MVPVSGMQLTFEGGEVPHPANVYAPSADLTPTQREVMVHLREHGSISPKQAGLFLYAVQRTPWRAPYASADGSEVLRRLALRGLVHRERRGVWVAGPGPRPQLRRSEKGRRAS